MTQFRRDASTRAEGSRGGAVADVVVGEWRKVHVNVLGRALAYRSVRGHVRAA